MTTLLTAVLLTGGVWVALCLLAHDALVRRAPAPRDAKAHRAWWYLSWVQGKNHEGGGTQVFLTAPIWFLLTLGHSFVTEPGEDKLAEAKAEASKLWNAGRIWLHPGDQPLWRINYQIWWDKEFSQRVSKVTRSSYVGMHYKVAKLQQEAVPCNCLNPTQARTSEGYAYCKQGHVLPKDGPAILWK